MSKDIFSILTNSEAKSKLSMLDNSQGNVTVWKKGQKEKFKYNVTNFDRTSMQLYLNAVKIDFNLGESVLCSFTLKGLNFFAEVVYQQSSDDNIFLKFNKELYKTERRNSFRLLTFSHFDIWAEFRPESMVEGENIIEFKTRIGHTELFKRYLRLVDNQGKDGEDDFKIKIRVVDISATGMALQIGHLEEEYFKKDMVYENVEIIFAKDVVKIPRLKIVYIVDYINSNSGFRTYKVGIHFENLPTVIDNKLGSIINNLLRDQDFGKDFEQLIK